MSTYRNTQSTSAVAKCTAGGSVAGERAWPGVAETNSSAFPPAVPRKGRLRATMPAQALGAQTFLTAGIGVGVEEDTFGGRVGW